MIYSKQVVEYVKKNYFESKKIVKSEKLKEKRKNIVLICEKLSISLLEVQMKKEVEIFKKRVKLLDKVVIKTKYIKEYLLYILSEKYKKQEQINKRIVFYLSAKELKRVEEELKEILEKNEELVYSSKKSKKYEYNEKEVKINILYMYIYDYFVSVEYLKEALRNKEASSVVVIIGSLLKIISVISMLKILKVLRIIDIIRCQRLIK